MAQDHTGMPDEPQVIVRKYPGRHVRMTYRVPDEVTTQAESARIAVQALIAFGSEWWQPLSVDQALACCDPVFWYPSGDCEPEHRFRTLFSATAPPGLLLQSAWEHAQEESAYQLTDVVVLQWAISPLDVPCPGPSGAAVVGWNEILVQAARVRLPNALREARSRHLAIRAGAGTALVPLEVSLGEAWVAGPRFGRADPAPVDLRMVNDSRLLTLDIGLHWSPWSDTTGAGVDDIQVGLRRLAALGWQAAP